ncbi:MAG: hypothetical protein H6708_22220 [Kofleriaceae bacterium]|nr:hypothetical protein [Myxococcales bacterium]MCB9563124.1 hypothetical protein [Kofleriaceae bacterium]
MRIVCLIVVGALSLVVGCGSSTPTVGAGGAAGYEEAPVDAMPPAAPDAAWPLPRSHAVPTGTPLPAPSPPPAPPSPPPARPVTGVRAKIINTQAIAGGARIVVDKGSRDGVQVGWHGVVLDRTGNPMPGLAFVVARARVRVSSADIGGATLYAVTGLEVWLTP